MRRFLTTASAVLLLAGVVVAVGVESANADITAPAANAVLRGTVTISDTGGVDKSSILGIAHCGGSVHTTIQLINSAGTTVFSSVHDGSGAYSVSVTTENYANGSYRVHTIDGNGGNSGFGGFGCTTNNVTHDENVTIDNIVSVAYTGATTAPENTSATVSATLSDPNMTPGALAGQTITFTLSGGGSVNAQTDSTGTATTTLSMAGPPRSTTITASFAKTSFYDAASDSKTFIVTQDRSVSTLDVPTATVHGQATHFRVIVNRVEGVGTPTGQVQFTLDGNPYGGPVTIVGNTATTPDDASLSTGSHTIGANYLGDTNFLPSSATTVTQVVNQAQTTTVIASAPNPSVTGQAVTFTATVAVVAPGAGTPAGSVQFTVDGHAAGTAIPLTGNHASLTLTSLSRANHNVTATYTGNTDFATSTSAVLTQGVNKAATSVALVSSDPTSVTGEAVSFTATVAAADPGSGTPDGQVQFTADGVNLGSPVDLVGGTATSDAISTLAPGTHTIVANYLGSDSYSGQSQTITQTVNAAATTSVVTSSPNPSVHGQPVTFSATVSAVAPGSGTPTGQVQFYVDGLASGTPVDLVDGQASSAPVADLATGTHQITVTYLGSDAYVTSTSDAVTQTVNKAPTAATLTSSVNPSVYGQAVTFKVHVAAAAPGAGQPTGSVSLTFSSLPGHVFTVPVNALTGDSNDVIVTILPVGQSVVTATYSGDGDFLASTDSLTQTVLKAQTSLTLTSSQNPSQSGQSVSFTATVTPVAPGVGDPTGTVTFFVNGARLGSPVTVASGVATSSAFASLSPGTYSITATYSGDRNFLGSDGVLDQGNGQTVTAADTSMVLTGNPTTAAYGAPVTFTATVSAVAPATGHPTGVVQFYEGTTLLGATQLVPDDATSSHASFVTTSLATGPHSIRAVYVGNFNFTGSTQSATVTVGVQSTTTGVSASPNPVTFGATTTLTAQVSAGNGAPTGTVTFYEGSTVLGSAPLSTVQGAQRASVDVSGLSAGTHTVHAVYGGSSSFAASTSAGYAVTVNRAASKVIADQIITCAPGGCTGNGGYVRATLTGVNGAPLAGETLRFTYTQSTDHATVHICDAITDANGVASCYAASWLPAITFYGGYDVNFYGDANYLPATDHGTIA